MRPVQFAVNSVSLIAVVGLITLASCTPPRPPPPPRAQCANPPPQPPACVKSAAMLLPIAPAPNTAIFLPICCIPVACYGAAAFRGTAIVPVLAARFAQPFCRRINIKGRTS